MTISVLFLFIGSYCISSFISNPRQGVHKVTLSLFPVASRLQLIAYKLCCRLVNRYSIRTIDNILLEGKSWNPQSYRNTDK